MVYYFMSAVVSPPVMIYMGEDKYENEELLKWGFPEDVWFHVDKMSSAHVYLRLPKGMSFEEIPAEVMTDCAQLVKANSIEVQQKLGVEAWERGNSCKTNNVNIVYTPFSNLKKTQGMDVGQVGFHSSKMVRSVLVEKKLNEVVNRLNKTQKQRKPDLREEREQRDREERRDKRQQQQAERQRQKEEEERLKKEAELRSYTSLMKEENMRTNQYDADVDYKALEDDFM